MPYGRRRDWQRVICSRHALLFPVRCQAFHTHRIERQLYSRMLYHLRPRLFALLQTVELIDVALEPLGLVLRGGIDLATRRPYANKHYAVACRRQGRKAVDGILIEAPAPVDVLHYVARWAVDAASIVTHHVDYVLLDRDFDTATDDMILWLACDNGPNEWPNRTPAWAEGQSPASAETIMEVVPGRWNRGSDMVNANGRIVERYQEFKMPTIERERLMQAPFRIDRRPAYEAAFRQGSR